MTSQAISLLRFVTALLSMVVLPAICVVPQTLWAQSAANSGQIVGQILDPSGAAVAGSDVTVRHKDTNFTRRATTDNAGRYAVSDLPLGLYVVSVQASGFQSLAQDGFVSLGSSVSLNFNLALAGKAESVDVTNDAPGIEPTRSAPKSILTDLQIHRAAFKWTSLAEHRDPDSHRIDRTGVQRVFYLRPEGHLLQCQHRRRRL